MTDQVLKLHFKLCGDCCCPRRGPCTVPSWLRAPLPEPGWQPIPGFLPGESQGWGTGGLPSMGSHRVRHP